MLCFAVNGTNFMQPELTFKLVNCAVSERADKFDYANKNIRRVTVTASVGGEIAGTLTAYQLDIKQAHGDGFGHLSEVSDLFDIDPEGELDSLCYFAYGTQAQYLNDHFRNRQHIFTGQFRKIAAKLGYQKPGRLDLLCGHSDFNKRILYISRVTVEPKFRCRGIGRKLIQQLSRYRNKIDYITLLSFPYQEEFDQPNSTEYHETQNKLDRFYMNMGFEHCPGTRWMMHTPAALHHQQAGEFTKAA